jgi:hypothetical protein
VGVSHGFVLNLCAVSLRDGWIYIRFCNHVRDSWMYIHFCNYVRRSEMHVSAFTNSNVGNNGFYFILRKGSGPMRSRTIINVCVPRYRH